ncbi:protein CFAP20DC [Pelodytes ibericus]
MFKNEYQGGAYVEIFSAQGKDPVAKWKLYGSQSAIWKDFDKEVRSFVFVLEGSSQTNKMQLPKETKQSLGLIQQFLVLQLYIPIGPDFSAELLITDLANTKRRLYLSTIHKELSATLLHAKIPLAIVKRKVWCNLCIDLVAFTSGIFKGAVFQSLDGIIVSANCKLRKIYTMKLRPRDTAEERDNYGPMSSSNEPTDSIPRSCQITTDVHQVTQVLDLIKLRQNETKCEGKLLIPAETDQLSNRGQGSSRSSRGQDKSHIAFGSKVLGPPPATSRRTSSRTTAETTRSSSRHDRSLQQLPHERGSGLVNAPKAGELSPTSMYSIARKDKENIQQSSKKELCFHDLTPHPPLEPPTAERNRRISGVGSAGKERRNWRTNSTVSSERNALATGGSSLGYCRNEDKQTLQIHMPSCETMNRTAALNDFTARSTSANLPEKWIYQDSFQSNESKLSDIPHPTDALSEQLADNTSNTDTNEGEDMFTYTSMPHSAPHGKFHSQSLRRSSLSLLEDNQHDGRGAQLEEDFYGSDGSIEDHSAYQWTSSPKLDRNTSTSADISVETALGNTELSPPKESVRINPPDSTSFNESSLNGKITDFQDVQKNLMPTRSLSPDGSRPQISPTITKSQQLASVNKVRTPMSKKSLKEIPKDYRGMNFDAPGYDWTNYQSSRLSVSEMQMLASLKRQQNEELEDDGTLHGLSQSQIDHCNVDMSTSSDDTTTWNSCLPPPVNQGCHYEKEMNPLNHSNPRDWLNAFSPPIIPLCQTQDKTKDPLWRMKAASPGSCNDGDDGFGPEEEDILTLLYDPCLNCYFDPETGKYYELA